MQLLVAAMVCFALTTERPWPDMAWNPFAQVSKGPGFLFGGDTGLTADQLREKRAYYQRMGLGDLPIARTKGGGIANALTGLSQGIAGSRADAMGRAATERTAAADKSFMDSFFSPGTDVDPTAAAASGGGTAAASPEAPLRRVGGAGSSHANFSGGGDGSLMAKYEGAGNYDTLFGHSQNEGGQFAGTKVSQMTLGELKQFSSGDGQYGHWVQANNPKGDFATPMGRFQIVGKTLRGAQQALGLPDDTVFSPEVQRQMAGFLADERLARAGGDMGSKMAAIRSEWDGFRHVPDAELAQAISAYEQGDPTMLLGGGDAGRQPAPAPATTAQVAQPDPVQVASLDPSSGFEQAFTRPEGLTPEQQMQVQPGHPAGDPGTPGEIRTGSDGKQYQFAETRGMQGATADFGWIPYAGGSPKPLAEPPNPTPLAPEPRGAAAFNNAFTGAPPDGSVPLPSETPAPPSAGAPAAAVAPPPAAAAAPKPVQVASADDFPVAPQPPAANARSMMRMQQLMETIQNPDVSEGTRKMAQELFAREYQLAFPAPLTRKEQLDQELTEANIAKTRSETGRKKAPETREVVRNGKSVVLQWNDEVGDWEELADGKPISDTPHTKEFYDAESGKTYIKQYIDGDWQTVGEATPNGGITLTQNADGSTTTQIGGSRAGKPTEDQGKSLGLYNRGAAANKMLEGPLEKELTDFIQTNADKILPLGIDNYFKTPAFQRATVWANGFLTAVLRKETGAAVTEAEWQIYGPMFLPMPGDDESAIADKRQMRRIAMDGIKKGLGPLEAIAEADNAVRGLTKEDTDPGKIVPPTIDPGKSMEENYN